MVRVLFSGDGCCTYRFPRITSVQVYTLLIDFTRIFKNPVNCKNSAVQMISVHSNVKEFCMLAVNAGPCIHASKCSTPSYIPSFFVLLFFWERPCYVVLSRLALSWKTSYLLNAGIKDVHCQVQLVNEFFSDREYQFLLFKFSIKTILNIIWVPLLINEVCFFENKT